LWELDLQFPVIRLLVEDLKTGVAAVCGQTEGQEMRGITMPFQPGDLKN
jgi:hypothetical protein